MFVKYDEFVRFMENQKDRVYSLDNFKKYMQDQNNPQFKLSCIHVGGTNGKGSTTNYIKDVLVSSGYRIGTFISPHLINRLDIIQINNVSINESRILEIANRNVEKWLEYKLSIFEIEMCISVLYFLEEEVDFVLYEVGLGGTLDATNIIKPLLSVNTNVMMDHIEFLGDTYCSIASNKAGIVKETVPYITGEKKQECIDIFNDICKKKNSELILTKEITNIKYSPTSYNYRGYQVKLSAIAKYQVYNSALAIEVLIQGRNRNFFHFEDETMLKSIELSSWKGRFEIINKNPLIIIDGAHNKEGIEAFVESAKDYEDIKIIFGAFKDKDHQSMLQCLQAICEDITVCSFEHERSASVKQLQRVKGVKVSKSYKASIDEAMMQDKILFITGSLYFISLVRAYIIKKGGVY